VAEGTRIIEYPAVAIEERNEKIESIEDMVLGDDLSDQQQIFYQVSGSQEHTLRAKHVKGRVLPSGQGRTVGT